MSDFKHLLIHMEDVYQRYPDKDKGGVKTVLNNIDLAVGEGEFVALVGPSGCGKSTLLRLMLGWENQTSGLVLVDRKPVDGPSRDRGIVFQQYSLYPDLTAVENVELGPLFERTNIPQRLLFLPNYWRSRSKAREEAIYFMERVGLKDHLHKYPYQLSGGQQQRVAIAQAMIMKPKILLMDEPFGALDDMTRQEMQLFLLELWEGQKMTVIFVTHDLEEALFLGTRIVVLSQFYTADTPCEGAKIVADLPILDGVHPKPSYFKYSPEFNELLRVVRNAGLEPDIRQHIRDFSLKHPHSFRTPAKGEWIEYDKSQGR